MSESSINFEIIPVIEDNNVELVFVEDHYSLANYDEFMQTLKNIEAQADNYVYHEDDRAAVKKLNAEINKYIKAFTTKNKEIENQLLGEVRQQKKDIDNQLAIIMKKLKMGIEKEDKQYKQDKLNKFIHLFEDAKSSIDELKDTDLEYYQINESSWLNRSTSETSVVNTIHERLTTIKLIISNALNPVDDMEIITDTLKDFDWNGLTALDKIIKDYNEEQKRIEDARLLAEAKAKKEREDLRKKELEQSIVYDEIEEDSFVSIKINTNDWLDVKELLERYDIKYELGE